MDMRNHAIKKRYLNDTINSLRDIVKAARGSPESHRIIDAIQHLTEFDDMLRIDEDAFVRTVSGRVFKLYKCSPDDILTSDIIWSLCGQNRFLHHTNKPYSVGQHLVFGYWLAKERNMSDEIIKHWLLHDAHEAYNGDLIAPVKRAGSNLAHELATYHIERQIEKRYGVSFSTHCVTVKRIDEECLAREDKWRSGGGADSMLLEAVNMSYYATHAMLSSLFTTYVSKS